MKKRKNAFTLIELLAVIVILAVIALIATPIILGIVEDAKKDAFLRSVELVVSSTDLDVMDKVTDSGYQYELIDGNLIDNTVEKELIGYEIVDKEKCIIFFANIGMPEEMATSVCNNEPIAEDNKTFTESALEHPEETIMYIEEGFLKEVYNYTDLGLAKNLNGMNGTINYDANGQEEYAIHNGVYCVMKTSDMSKAEISDYVEGECSIFTETPANYFTYEIKDVYAMVNKDACITYLEEDGSSWPKVTVCNNERSYGGMTFLEQIELTSYYEEEKTGLLNVGAIESVDKVIQITGYSDEGPKDVVIPEYIDGKKVVYIGDNAFYNKGLTSVAMPNSVIILGEGAFQDNKIKTVKLSNTLAVIGGYSFQGSFDGTGNQITKLKIPSSVTSIGIWAFAYNAIQEVTIEKDEIYLEKGCFCGNPLPESSTSYQKIYSIDSNAFNCVVD